MEHTYGFLMLSLFHENHALPSLLFNALSMEAAEGDFNVFMAISQ
jgi:hypothetical protein